MIDPQAQIFNKISELQDDFPDLKVYKTWPQTFEDFPTITFRIEDDRPSYTLDNGMGNQVITLRIDIWADDGIQTAELLEQLESKMLEINYRLSTHSDILEPDGGNHLTTQFIF